MQLRPYSVWGHEEILHLLARPANFPRKAKILDTENKTTRYRNVKANTKIQRNHEGQAHTSLGEFMRQPSVATSDLYPKKCSTEPDLLINLISSGSNTQCQQKVLSGNARELETACWRLMSPPPTPNSCSPGKGAGETSLPPCLPCSTGGQTLLHEQGLSSSVTSGNVINPHPAQEDCEDGRDWGAK